MRRVNYVDFGLQLAQLASPAGSLNLKVESCNQYMQFII